MVLKYEIRPSASGNYTLEGGCRWSLNMK
jgi:hypothetical protein